MPSGFSKRQLVLLERLEKVCQRAAADDLPVRIEEVWGFGSFFRLKESPQDLDLAIKYSRGDDTLWRGFHEEMEKGIHMAWDKRADYPAPSDALRATPSCLPKSGFRLLGRLSHSLGG